MRVPLSTLSALDIVCNDGEAGKVKDFLFDDAKWTIRYFAVDTGRFLDRQRVLVTPPSVRAVDVTRGKIFLTLSKEALAASPDIDEDKPVSRQEEENLYRHYGYSRYWLGTGAWGMGPAPAAVALMDDQAASPTQHEEPSGDPHLRSVKAVTGYEIHANDGDLGAVEDFIIDDATFAIRYLVIDTSRWWFGKKVLIAPLWVQAFNWAERSCTIALTRDAIKAAPEWYPGRFVDDEYELALSTHYGSKIARKSPPATVRREPRP